MLQLIPNALAGDRPMFAHGLVSTRALNLIVHWQDALGMSIAPTMMEEIPRSADSADSADLVDLAG